MPDPTLFTNINDFAEHITGERERVDAIAKRIFRATSSGVRSGFQTENGADLFWVAGFTEGWGGEHPKYKLQFPFTLEQYEEALTAANTDGSDMWDHPDNTRIDSAGDDAFD